MTLIRKTDQSSNKEHKNHTNPGDPEYPKDVKYPMKSHEFSTAFLQSEAEYGFYIPHVFNYWPPLTLSVRVQRALTAGEGKL